ncbi:MAG: beta-ketoacyl-ACP synthase [Deltaproteobacteria bacterium]|nr:beta-ketoacyl-ACP synthase [Deltaproteobacteria bacterium]MBW2392828.1 beta-ketoacyl-ACP synthase [Deltaproteobacteria bacterium]
MKRVVVTGMGGLCSLGSDWKTVRDALLAGRNGTKVMPGWEHMAGLKTCLGAPVPDFELPESWPRKKARSMGRDSAMAVRATEIALEGAGLLGSPELSDGTTGVSYGSTAGSPGALDTWAESFYQKNSLSGIGANQYVRFMSHTCAANLAQFFQLRGRVIPTCSACTSGSQGIGYGYEAIKYGHHDIMVAGGAEELGLMDVAVFDILFAASTRNDQPDQTPRPFDVARDGLVCSEGAATFILEEREHALARGATIHAEVLGFATNCDGRHITNPDAGGMEKVMRLGLESAALAPEAIGYVNAHGTATEVGDIAESQATAEVFGKGVPVSSLKGFLGHALGACGSLEAWLSIEMMRDGWFAPNRGLEEVDPRCAELDYIRDEPRKLETQILMSNNFAFGGINTSLIFGRDV